MDQADNLRNLIKKQSLDNSTARVITVTSGKGGVGKSNIAVNLAIQLQRLGNRVIVFDADFGLANIEVMLGIRPVYTLADLIFRGKTLKDIITKTAYGIEIISGGSGIQELVNMTDSQITYLNQKLRELDQYADIIIIDTGAGVAGAVMEFVASSSEILLVTTPEPTSITDAYVLLKTLNQKSTFSNENSVIKLIANRVTSSREGKELYHKLSLVVAKYLNIQIEYLGVIPQDSNVSKAVMQQKPVIHTYPHAVFSKAVYEFADVLCDNNVEERQQPQSGILRLFSNVLQNKIFKK